MENYIKDVIKYYNLNEEYTIAQEYDASMNMYYVDIYSTLNSPTELPKILLNNHEEFLINLNKIIIKGYPNYIKNSLKINYFENKIWISFTPLILDLHVITINAYSTRNEYKLKELIMSISNAARGKFNIHHHIFYDPSKHHIKHFNFKKDRYVLEFKTMKSNDSILKILEKTKLYAGDVLIFIPTDFKVDRFLPELYDLYENKIERLNTNNPEVYATKYYYLKY